MFRTVVLTLVFALSLDAAPRTRAVAPPPFPLAMTGELTTADPVFGPASGFEQLPRVAAGGGIGLVVWNGGMKAVRLRADGQLIDPVPIPVLPQSFTAISDVVFHDGAFTFAAAIYVPTGEPYDLLLARVTPAGEVSTHLLGRTLNAFSLSLATNGRELLAAVHTREGIDTYFIAADETVTLGPRLAGATPKLASDGTDFLMLHRTGLPFAVTRIGRDRTPGEAAPIALADAHDLLWNGTDYVVLGLVTDVLRGVRVSAAGVPGEAFLEVPAGAGTQFPSFSWTGSEYRVLWKQRGAPDGTLATYDTRAARVGANGHVIESVRLRERADVYLRRPAIGTTDVAGTLMTWGESFEQQSNVVATASMGMPVEVVSRRANEQYQSAIVQNGAATLVVSVDDRHVPGDAGLPRLSIARVHADGTHAPGPGTVLYPARGAQDFPDAAWNGTDTWIVWRESAGVFAARVDANGTLLDREPIAVADGSVTPPQIACGPADCVVMWTDNPFQQPQHVRALRFAPNGTRLDAQPQDHGPGWVEDVIRAGDDYAFIRNATPHGLHLVRMRGGSTPLAASPTYDAALAWSGREFLAVWREADLLVYTRVDAAGHVLGAPQSLGGGLFPAAIWTGRHFLLAWWHAPVIRGARITRGGVVADTFPLSEPGNQTDPALAIRDDGTIAVSFTRFYSGWPYWNAERTLVRFTRD